MNQPRKYVGSQVYLRVYSHLIATAERRERTTYSVIAKLMGLPPSGNHMGREIGIMLGEISEAEDAQQRPMLSAIVVNTSGMPGPGFFNHITFPWPPAKEPKVLTPLLRRQKNWLRSGIGG